MNRRTLCRQLAAGAAATLVWRPSEAAQGSRTGLQLYTVRDHLEDDFEGTLRAVAEIGFGEVEFAGYFDRTPAQVAAAVRAAGLAPVASHVPVEMLRTSLDQLIRLASAIGHRYLIQPYLGESERTLDGYRALADEMNGFGERCQAAGIGFGYHNHAFEFEPVDGQIPYDLLLERTDPGLVSMELDLFWITKGGRDPLEYFEAWPGRFPLWHVKDMDRDGEMVDPGQGTIDFAAIFARARQAGMRHYFVEHDRPRDSLATARAGHEFLRRLSQEDEHE